jgi:hypothetical protein
MANVAIVEFPYLRTPMNLQYLQDLYFQHPCLKSLTDEIVLPGSKLICLKNAQASSFSFLATSVFKQLDVNHVFILDDKETAAYFLTQKYPHVMFKLLDEKDPSELIWKMIKPEHSKPFKLEI